MRGSHWLHAVGRMHSKPRLLAADAQRSDDPNLEAPAAAAASPSPNLETAPTMQRVTGTFTDPLHESAFAAQLFRMAFSAHVVLMALILAWFAWNAFAHPEMRVHWAALVLCGALPALVCRVLLHRTGSRDPVRSQRIGSLSWAVLFAPNLVADMAHFILDPETTRLFALEVKFMIPFVHLCLALVNGSHGLGFTCKFALVALLLADNIVGMISCADPQLDPWFICAIGAVVLGAATAHTAELYLRHSYAEKAQADAETMRSRAEAAEKRQLEERMEQLQAEKERLLYDMQRRVRPLDNDEDRSAIRRGLQAGQSQPYPASLGGTDPDTEPSEAEGPAPSDSLPTLPPGPPSSASSASLARSGVGSNREWHAKEQRHAEAAAEPTAKTYPTWAELDAQFYAEQRAAAESPNSSTTGAASSPVARSTIPPPSWAELAYRRFYAERAARAPARRGGAPPMGQPPTWAELDALRDAGLAANDRGAVQGGSVAEQELDVAAARALTDMGQRRDGR